MLLYPAPTLLTGAAAPVMGDPSLAPFAAVCAMPGMVHGECKSFHNFNYMDPLPAGFQTYMQPGMTFHPTDNELKELALTTKSKGFNYMGPLPAGFQTYVQPGVTFHQTDNELKELAPTTKSKGFNYMDPLPAGFQTYVQPGMTFHQTDTEFEKLAPATKSRNSRKKRRRARQNASSTKTPSSAWTPPLETQAALTKRGQDVVSAAGKEVSLTGHPHVDQSASTFGKKCPWGNLTDLGQNSDRCNEVKAQLGAHIAVALPMFKWILPAAKALALSKHGCRVIQKAIEVAQPILGGDNQDLIIDQLKGSVVELYKSPNGNHVVTKMIEVLPPAHLGFLLEELAGTAVIVARHQYGCRVLERLIEHCQAVQIAGLVEEVLEEAESLCRHPFGNFVMQHIFEHGLQDWKDKIAEQIAETNIFEHGLQSWKIALLAKHRTASHVVQSALDHGGEDIQRILITALMSANGEDSFVDVACSRYGSFVVEEIANIQAYSGMVAEILKVDLSRLTADQYGKRVAAKFDLVDELPSV